MKLKEKSEARRLRFLGCSLNEIQERLGIAKSSISLWVRDVELTPEQKKELSRKGIQKGVIEQRRATRLKTKAQRDKLL